MSEMDFSDSNSSSGGSPKSRQERMRQLAAWLLALMAELTDDRRSRGATDEDDNQWSAKWQTWRRNY